MDIKLNKENFYSTKSKRLKRYLHTLGFEYKSEFRQGKEYFIFEDSDNLRKSVEFFYEMRKNFWKGRNLK